MNGLSADLCAIVGEAFAAEGLSAGLGKALPSDRPDLAQFQCNGALAAAKLAKTNPRALAGKIAERLKANPLFAKVDIAGPGFLNLDVADAILSERAGAMAADEELGAPQTGGGRTVIVDYGGANVAKPMHVGHLRTAIIGDSLKRLFRANGWNVVGDVHLGDWGLQMGQLISEIELGRPDLPYFDAGFCGPYPDEPPVTMDDLSLLYPKASAACKESPERLEAARRATHDLQSGRPGYLALWRHFVNVSMVGLKREYGSLGVEFELWKGESDAEPLIGPMVEDLKARGFAVPSEGALVVPVAREDDKKEIPPLLLVKSDGAALYGTTDLATIVDRVKAYDPELVLYVVDQRQHGHFEQVFRAAEKCGLKGNAALEHIGFGTMNGADGKPFKTRAGGVLKLFDLIAMATAEAEKRIAEAGLGADYSPEERTEIAKTVGIAALKFADLSNYRLTDYVFDLERFTRFEGKTGPYLQYAAVRTNSILRKAEGEGFAVAAPEVNSAEERALVLKLLALPDAMIAAEEMRAPNLLCDYAFTLAQEYSRFYAAHHILSEQDEHLRASRLGLCKLTVASLIKVLSLLGIDVPPKM
jgi:arginyl-tRNA synthetase